MDAFLWGVATSAYQTEGGYNGPGEPRTNWARAEEAGDVARLGKSADFWRHYAEDFARCRAMGLNAFRLGLEWSRVQPGQTDVQSMPPPFDYAALDHYVAILEACLAEHLEPVVTLHHFVHPAWLGADPWLEKRTAEWFEEFVVTTVRYLNERLPRPIRWFVTINEPNMLVLNTYLGTQFPTQAQRGPRMMMRAYNELLRAHVFAYNALHDLYTECGWLAPKVSFNTYCSDVYWSDKVLLDLVTARERGVTRATISAHIGQRAREFDRAFREARLPLHRDIAFFFGSAAKRLSNWFGYKLFSLEHFDGFLDALYASSRECLLDYVGIDYYDPFAAHAFRLPVWWDHEFKNKSLRSWILSTITSKWWDWRVLPRGLNFFCAHYATAYGRPVLIAENGMALRSRPDGRQPRRDQMTRSQFLQLHVHEVRKIRSEGVPLVGYLYWSLMDNYEWGTYTPRFGLFGIDFAGEPARISHDRSGDEPSRTYASLVREAREAETPPSSR